jgi:hypothetical protein
VTVAARALACAASRVSRAAVVRARRAVDFVGVVPPLDREERVLLVDRDACVPVAARVVARRAVDPEPLRAAVVLRLRALVALAGLVPLEEVLVSGIRSIGLSVRWLVCFSIAL